MDINNCNLVGRLTADPVLEFTANNKTVCKFSIANNGRQADDVSFFNIVTWNKTAENCNKYLHKGNRVIIQGNLKQDRWKSKEGQMRSAINVVANMVQFLEKAPDKTEPTNEDFEDLNSPVETNELPFK